MKKLLSLITALMILLSFSLALAEPGTELTVGVTLDTQTLPFFIQAFGGVTSEEEMKIVSSVLALVNNLTAVVNNGSGAADISLRLKGAEVATFNVSQTEEGVAIVSSLFPNNALTFDPAVLTDLVKTSGIEFSPEMLTETLKVFEPYASDFSRFAIEFMTEVEAGEGEYILEGIGSYTWRMKAVLTQHQGMSLLKNWIARAETDTALQTLLQSVPGTSSNGVNLSETFAAMKTQIESALQLPDADLLEILAYTGDAGSYYNVHSLGMKEFSFQVTVQSETAMGRSAGKFTVAAAAGEVLDWDTAVKAILNGENTKGLVLQGNMESLTDTAGKSTKGSLQLLAGGLNVGLMLDSMEPADPSQPKTTDIGFAFGGTPLAVFHVSSISAEAAVAADLTGKSRIAISPSMKEEDIMPLVGEMMYSGLPALISAMSAQMPDEMGLLMAMLNPVSPDASALPPSPEVTVETPVPSLLPEVTAEPVTTAATEAPAEPTFVPEVTETPAEPTIVPELTEEPVAEGPGKYAIIEESFMVLPYFGAFQGNVFAKVRNAGGESLEMGSGKMELFDAAGTSIGSTDIYSCYPDVLQPGETGYVTASLSVDTATDKNYIASYKLDLPASEYPSRAVTLLPAAGKYEIDKSGYWETHYLTALVENNTDKTQYNLNVLFAVRDAAGKLVYVVPYSSYNVGILPHTSAEVRSSLYSDVITYFTENGIELASIEAIAYLSDYK